MKESQGKKKASSSVSWKEKSLGVLMGKYAQHECAYTVEPGGNVIEICDWCR